MCDDDWLVLRDGAAVGRVHTELLTNPSRNLWMWFKQVGYGRQGEEPTLAAALEALRAAILAETPDQAAGSISSGPSSGMPNR